MTTLRVSSNDVASAFSREQLRALPEPFQVPDVGAVVRGREGRAVRLAGVLAQVAVGPDAEFVHVRSSDETFTANIPIESALASGLVLYELDGAPLPEQYGGPFRLLFTDATDCSVNLKALGSIDVVRDPGSHTARCADDR